ncbi:MAG: hypothetical protein NTV81_04290 [Candidatus Komeilibacteria bacterium]|nr:hypothetical protein [Candidatus Komeilibacteria bacterium]
MENDPVKEAVGQLATIMEQEKNGLTKFIQLLQRQVNLLLQGEFGEYGEFEEINEQQAHLIVELARLESERASTIQRLEDLLQSGKQMTLEQVEGLLNLNPSTSQWTGELSSLQQRLQTLASSIEATLKEIG